MRQLVARLLRPRRRRSPPVRQVDAERLLRIYRETVAEVQRLKRAA